MAEWEKYGINIAGGGPSALGVGEARPDGAELETIFHIVHVSAARRILEDGRLSAQLVVGESKLHRSPAGVAWMSANEWKRGSIHGTVRFSFAWKKIIRPPLSITRV